MIKQSCGRIGLSTAPKTIAQPANFHSGLHHAMSIVESLPFCAFKSVQYVRMLHIVHYTMLAAPMARESRHHSRQCATCRASCDECLRAGLKRGAHLIQRAEMSSSNAKLTLYTAGTPNGETVIWACIMGPTLAATVLLAHQI